MGDYPALQSAAIAGLTLYWANRQRRLLLAFLLTIISSKTMLWLAKFGFNRPRPEFLTDVTASSASFPSGHTTGAVAVYGFTAFSAVHLLPARRAQFMVAVCAATIIGLVAFSRTLLHVHYPSDGLAGLFLGALWLVAGVALERMSEGRPVR